MKVILKWNHALNKYDVTEATYCDIEILERINKYIKKIRHIHNRILRDADEEYQGDVSRFIDDCAYSAYTTMMTAIGLVKDLQSKVGIEFNVDKYIIDF